MKGPSLHHELKVLRVWKCPACGRNVRTGGEVTVRTCDCNDQSQMMYSAAEPLSAADVSGYATYMTPEFQEDNDDGTDLPLPDIDSLTISAREPHGPRNRPGKPLRDTIAEELAESEDDTFGDGLVVSEPETTAVTSQARLVASKGSEVSDAQTDDRVPKKRRRRRRRRRSRSSGHSRPSDTSVGRVAGQRDAVLSPEDTQLGEPSTDSTNIPRSSQSVTDSGAGANTDEVPESGENRDDSSVLRKRRRPRKKNNPVSDSGNGESGSSPTGGTDS